MSGNGVHGSGGPAGELNELFEGVPWAADDDEVVGARPEEAPIAVNVAIGEEVAGAAEVAAGVVFQQFQSLTLSSPSAAWPHVCVCGLSTISIPMRRIYREDGF